MANFIFQLGGFPELSKAELELVSGKPITPLTPRLGLVELASAEEATTVFQQLGGCSKVWSVLPHKTSKADLQDWLTACIQQRAPKAFAVSVFDQSIPQPDLHQIKLNLSKVGVKTRYVDSSNQGLSTAAPRNILEFGLFTHRGSLLICERLVQQDVAAWVDRDRHKPYVNKKKGMLPPKLARIIVNLGLHSWQSENNSTQAPTLYDPFCGTGTVLQEAALLGLDHLGSDQDSDSVIGTGVNLTWLRQTYPDLPTPTQLFTAEAAHASIALPIDLIVTEPFLGKPFPQPDQLTNIFNGLERLYLGSFKHWTALFRPNSIGVAVMIWPQAQQGSKTFDLSSLLPKITQLGYSPITTQPWLYHRPQARIQRQIWIFNYQTN